MAVYVESGLRVELPEGRHFRFSTLSSYRKRSGQNLKEMDFCWIHSSGKLVLLEVRDYSEVAAALSVADFIPESGKPSPYRFQDLIDKITDSLLMILAVRLETEAGKELAHELPAACRDHLPLQIVIACNLPPALTSHLAPLKDALNARIRGRCALADIPRITLLDYDRLTTHPSFSPFVRLQSPEPDRRT